MWCRQTYGHVFCLLSPRSWLQVTNCLSYLKGQWVLFSWPLVLKFSKPVHLYCSWFMPNSALLLIECGCLWLHWLWVCLVLMCWGPVNRVGRLPVESLLLGSTDCSSQFCGLILWLLFSCISKWWRSELGFSHSYSHKSRKQIVQHYLLKGELCIFCSGTCAYGNSVLSALFLLFQYVKTKDEEFLFPLTGKIYE